MNLLAFDAPHKMRKRKCTHQPLSPPATADGLNNGPGPLRGYPLRYQRDTFKERKACCRISILGFMLVNITVYTGWGPGPAHAAQGCLKRTLNVVFEALSCGACGRVAFFFFSAEDCQLSLSGLHNIHVNTATTEG